MGERSVQRLGEVIWHGYGLSCGFCPFHVSNVLNFLGAPLRGPFVVGDGTAAFSVDLKKCTTVEMRRIEEDA